MIEFGFKEGTGAQEGDNSEKVFIRLAVTRDQRDAINEICSRRDVKRNGVKSVTDALSSYIDKCIKANNIV
jgi:hypothetical protein